MQPPKPPTLSNEQAVIRAISEMTTGLKVAVAPTKDMQVNVRLTQAELEAARAIAEELGVTVSDLFRGVIHTLRPKLANKGKAPFWS
jgi:hypothetical protein